MARRILYDDRLLSKGIQWKVKKIVFDDIWMCYKDNLEMLPKRERKT